MARPAIDCLRCLVLSDSKVGGRRLFSSTPINAVLRRQEPFAVSKSDVGRNSRTNLRQPTDSVLGSDSRGSYSRTGAEKDQSYSIRSSGSRSETPMDFQRNKSPRLFGKSGGFGMKKPMNEMSDRSQMSRSEGGEVYGGQWANDSRASGSREGFEPGKPEQARFDRSESRAEKSRRGGPDRTETYPSKKGTDRLGKSERDNASRRPAEMGRARPEQTERGVRDRSFTNLDRTRRGDGNARPSGVDIRHIRDTIKDSTPNQPWSPTKKLTFQAMAGLRALHANDPVTFDRDALSQRYGISYDAVTRIIRSSYQDRKGQETGEKIQGTKWDMNPATSRLSPVPAINRAFERAQGRVGQSGNERS